MNSHKTLTALLLFALMRNAAFAVTVLLSPQKDNTLYEDPTGQLSNGHGIYLFAGLTGVAGIRRGLIAFDLTSIPANATIMDATLSMFVSTPHQQTVTINISLNKALHAWGEGASNAGDPGGMGAQAEVNDATWLHTFYDTVFWTTPGGDFSPTISATTPVNAVNTTYIWSGSGLVADVQGWVSSPATNFGWVILANEVDGGTAQRLNSRENSGNPPQLAVTYQVSSATPTPTPTVTPPPVCDLMEGFDLVTSLLQGGWGMRNNSEPGPGTTGWFQGNTTVFTSQSGAANSYIGANFNSGIGTSTLSNWLLTPPLALQNGAQFTFWTRTVNAPVSADRLQVRMSTNGTSFNVGSTATSVGDFTTLLLDINPTYMLTGYPSVWTNFTVAISGLGSPVNGRIAFRYFVENGGPSGFNSDYIGIDSVQYACGGVIPTPTPSSSPTATPSPTATATPTAPSTFGNISTRLRVETGDNVLIGGFIVTGMQPKKVIVRAIGPSLPLAGALANPILELRNSSGGLIFSNDNWRNDQEAEIIATGIPPSNDLESAIVATLAANSSAYTAIVRGVNNGTGIGLVEAYDLDRTVNSKLANISTRGFVQTGDNVLIGGLIVLGQSSLRVIVRAIGPSLPVSGALADPTLELYNGNGALIRSNDNWRSHQEAEIIATGIAPSNNLESAIVLNLIPGNYTAIVRGVNNTTGIAVVEAYNLN